MYIFCKKSWRTEQVYLCVQVVSSSFVVIPVRNISQPACAIIAPLSMQNLEVDTKQNVMKKDDLKTRRQ